MAKIFRVLLAVVAVSLHAPHKVSAAPNFAGAFGWLKKPPNPAELKGKINDAADVAKWFIDQSGVAQGGGGSTPVPRITGSTPVTHSTGLYLVKVTGIAVGKQTLSLGSTLDVALVPDIPFTFLNKDAYELLKEAFTVERVASEHGAKFDQLCYPAGTEVPVTLVFDGGDEMKADVEDVWYKQDGGSMCLAILASPLETGTTTILGSMLLTAAGTKYDSDKGIITFQTSAKFTGSSSSNSNTAAATKPLLIGVWVILLLVMMILA